MTSILRTAAVAAALCLAATPASAQSLSSSGTGTWGQVSFDSGFQPDPYYVAVMAGGSIDASTANSSCVGFVPRAPAFTLRYRSGDYPLFIGAIAEGDATIVVRAPDGSWSCDDDSGGNLNPLVSWQDPPSGRYQIWVGRFGAQDDLIPAMIHISEVSGPEGVSGGGVADDGAPDFTLEPAYGVIELVSGFMPDPHTVEIAAGGTIDASTLGVDGCLGFIARAPDYRVNWTAGSGELPLIFSVSSDADTTLVINDAQGNWLCDDDGGNEGLNPAITVVAPASGQYDIWVGTYAPGDLQPSTLHVSELYSQ